VGLNVPTTYATKEVVAMRQQIANEFFKHQYYVDKINSIAASSFPWDKNGPLWKSMLSLSAMAKDNIGLIMDQTSGGILCFKDP
jgi:hypothetical protein